MADAPAFDAPSVAEPFSWRERSGVGYLEAAFPGARAAFSTRLGGVSEGPYRSLNLGILTADDGAHVTQNRDLVAEALGREPETIVMGRQVHGSHVEVRQSSDGRADRPIGEADAQVTRSPSLTPLVLVADCVPLVLVTRDAVAAVHCGWRGVVAGVIDRALEALRGSAEGSEVRAAIGPGIGVCCYEVGEEVRAAFQRAGHDQEVLPAGRLDLALAVRRVLECHGVDPHAIAAAGLCTSCNPELFFSHRRDGGVTGRQGGLAWLDR